MSHEQQGKRKTTGAARDASKPAQARYRRLNRGKPGVVADWESCDASLLQKAIACVSARGCALRLGYTRDGGSYAIGFYGDGDPYTEYVRPTEDIDQFLRDVAEDFDERTSTEIGE